MNFLKQLGKLFSGGGRPPGAGGDPGLYYYVRSKQSGEVLKVRVNPMSELSMTEDGKLYVRKVAFGSRGYDKVEIAFTFDTSKKLLNTEISGGEMATKADYDAQPPKA